MFTPVFSLDKIVGLYSFANEIKKTLLSQSAVSHFTLNDKGTIKIQNVLFKQDQQLVLSVLNKHWRN